MSAYDSMRLDDFLQRQETLTPKERAQFEWLYAKAYAESERESHSHPFMYGGDYPDL